MTDQFFRAQNAERRLNENVNLINRECCINVFIPDIRAQLITESQAPALFFSPSI